MANSTIILPPPPSGPEDTVIDIGDIVISDDDVGQKLLVTVSGHGGKLSFVLPGANQPIEAGTLTLRDMLPEEINQILETLTFTPSAVYIGDYLITVVVKDGENDPQPVQKDLTVAVGPVNDPPTVDKGIAGQSVLEDTEWTFVVPVDAFADVDGDPLTLSATLDDDTALPDWLTFTPGTRTFSGTPPQDFNGVIGLKVTADDGSESVSTTFDLTVTPVNDAPTLDVPSMIVVDEDSSNNPFANIIVGDADDDRLLVTVFVSDGFMSGDLGFGSRDFISAAFNRTADEINAALANFTYTPAPEANGTFFAKVTVDDLSGEPPVEKVFDIKVNPIDDPPTIALPSSPTVVEDSTDNPVGDIIIGDVDGDTLTVTLVASSTMSLGLTTGLVFTAGNDATDEKTMTFSGVVADINEALKTLTYTPTKDEDGDGSITVTVDDGNGPAVEKTLAIGITPVNDPPVIVSDGGGDAATIAVSENTTAVTTVVATDVDNLATTFDLGGPDGSLFIIDPATGGLSFKTAPDFENPTDSDGDNTYIVVVNASDGSATDTQTLSVDVDNVPGEALIGTKKKDKLVGTDEEDSLNGGKKKDKLTGGEGPDAFILDALPKKWAFGSKSGDFLDDFSGELLKALYKKKADSWADKITDFETGVDSIHIDNKVFKKIGPDGALKEKFFHVGETPESQKHRVFYDDKRGLLFHDQDGSRSKHDPIKIAKLSNKPDLSAADILVI